MPLCITFDERNPQYGIKRTFRGLFYVQNIAHAMKYHRFMKRETTEIFLLLDKKIAKEFHESAKQTAEYPHDVGEMRQLKKTLQNLCGITELEALNVLINRNVADYITKYNGWYQGYALEDRTKLIESDGND